MSAAVATLQRATVVVWYSAREPVRCTGMWRGRPCGRILARGLEGRVQIRCGKCHHTAWYGEPEEGKQKILDR